MENKLEITSTLKNKSQELELDLDNLNRFRSEKDFKSFEENFIYKKPEDIKSFLEEKHLSNSEQLKLLQELITIKLNKAFDAKYHIKEIANIVAIYPALKDILTIPDEIFKEEFLNLGFITSTRTIFALKTFSQLERKYIFGDGILEIQKAVTDSILSLIRRGIPAEKEGDYNTSDLMIGLFFDKYPNLRTNLLNDKKTIDEISIKLRNKILETTAGYNLKIENLKKYFPLILNKLWMKT